MHPAPALIAAFAAGSPTYDIAPLPCTTVTPNAISDAGHVVLVRQMADGSTRSFVWDGRTTRRVGTVGRGFVRHEASDVNR